MNSTIHAPVTFEKDGFTISTDPARLDVTAIHRFLSEEAYWAKGRPREVVERSIEHCLCFGVYEGQRQVGFARVLTDYAVMGYLMDVFILPDYRGHGLGKWLVQCILAHPALLDVKSWMLATRDAHGLYAQYGFHPLGNPEFYMQMRRNEK
jgi:GNAT superfamily N-acetyltransferase